MQHCRHGLPWRLCGGGRLDWSWRELLSGCTKPEFFREDEGGEILRRRAVHETSADGLLGDKIEHGLGRISYLAAGGVVEPSFDDGVAVECRQPGYSDGHPS